MRTGRWTGFSFFFRFFRSVSFPFCFFLDVQLKVYLAAASTSWKRQFSSRYRRANQITDWFNSANRWNPPFFPTVASFQFSQLSWSSFFSFGRPIDENLMSSQRPGGLKRTGLTTTPAPQPTRSIGGWDEWRWPSASECAILSIFDVFTLKKNTVKGTSVFEVDTVGKWSITLATLWLYPTSRHMLSIIRSNCISVSLFWRRQSSVAKCLWFVRALRPVHPATSPSRAGDRSADGR